MDFDKVKPVPLDALRSPSGRQDAGPKTTGESSRSPTTEPLQFDVTYIPEPRDRAERQNRLNSLYIRLIGLLVLIVPIPLASHRPVPWALWSVVVACLVLGFMLRLALREPDRKLRSLAHADLILLALVMPAFALLQLLPLGHLAPWAFAPDLAPTAITLNTSATLFAVLRLMSYAGVFFLTMEICSRPQRTHQLARYIFYGLTAHAVLAMISLNILGDRFLWGDKTSYLGWATGTFVNRNSFASFIGLGILTGIALVTARPPNTPQPRSKAHRNVLSPQMIETGIYWVCIALMGTALVASGSRMGLAATGIGTLVTLIALSGHSKPESATALTRPRKVILFVLVIGLTAIAILSQSVGERLIFSGVAFDTRLALYQNVWDLILTRPWTGYGLDSFELAYPLVHDDRVSPAFIWDLAHNTYLTLWAELGLIAGSASLLALAAAALRLTRALRRSAAPSLAIALSLGALSLAATHSLLDFSFEIEANAMLLIVLIAMGLSQTPRQPRGGRP